MSEHLHIYLESDQSADTNLDSAIASITYTNKDEITDSNGNFGTHKPTVEIVLNSYENYPTGFTFSWDFGLWNRPKSAYVDMYYEGGGHKRYTFAPQTPQMSSSWSVWETGHCVQRIVCTVNSALLNNQKLRFGGFHFGNNALDFSTTVTSCKILQSCDMSGLTAAYATLSAGLSGKNIEQYLTINQKLMIATELKEIGYFYIDDIAVTKYDSNGITAYSLKALSILGVLAKETYSGHAHGYRPYQNDEDQFQTILSDITNERLYIPTPSSCDGYAYPNIIQGVDRRTALANLALSVRGFVDPYGKIEIIGGNQSGLPVSIPASRIYDKPIITDQGALKSIEVKVYNFFYSSAANNHNASESHTYYIVTSIDGGPVTQVTKNGTSVKMEDVDWAVYIDADIVVSNAAGIRKISVDNYAIPGISASAYSYNKYDFQHLTQLLVDYYSRRRIWTGKILWNTATNEGKLGTLVTVRDANGNEFTGNVIQSNLTFSGASVCAEIKVLEE